MKAKLLKKLRKKHGVYFSKEKTVINSDTKKEIKGRFCVEDPFSKVWYYNSKLEDIIPRRRVIILEEVRRLRANDYKTKKRIL